MKSNHNKFKRTLVSLVITALFANQVAYALPGASTFTKGAGTVSTAGSNMTVNVTGTDNRTAVINWNGFNIAAGENVHFNNGASAMWGANILNVDNSGLMSQIHGGITTNGGINAPNVYISNVAGVNIGATANIATGGAFGVFTGRSSTVSASDGSNVTLPAGVMVDVTLNNAPITINPGATISAGNGNPNAAMNVYSSGSVTLPYLAGGGYLNLATNGANGTEYETNNSRLSDATYYLPDASLLYVSNSVIDGLASINYGAAPGNLLGLAQGSGSAVLTNNTIKSLASSSSGAALTFLNHVHTPLGAGGTGSTNSVLVDGLTVDASSGKKAMLNVEQYSDRVSFSTAPVIGVGNASDAFNGPEVRGWMGRFMSTDSSNRTFNGTNIGLTVSDVAMADGSKLITDPSLHAFYDYDFLVNGAASNPLNLTLDANSVFRFNLLSDVNRSYNLGNLNLANSKGFSFNWTGANTLNNNSLVLDNVSLNTSGAQLSFNAAAGDVQVNNSIWNSGNQTLRITGNNIGTQSSSFSSTSNIALTAADTIAVSSSNFTGAGTGINMTALNGKVAATDSTITANAGTLTLQGTNGDVNVDNSTITNLGRTINLTAAGQVSINSKAGGAVIDTGLGAGALNISANLGGNIAAPDLIRSKTINFNSGDYFSANGRIEADQLNLNNQLGSYYFDNVSTNKLAADVFDIAVVNDKTMTAQGVYSKNYVDLRTLSGDLNISGAVRTTKQNDPWAITLAADSNAVNDATGTGGNVKFLNSNPGNIQVGSGSNWVIWTGNPTGTNLGGNTPDRKRYNVNFTDPVGGGTYQDPFATMYPGTEGNREYFRNQPTLTLTPTAGQSKTYGAIDPASYAYGVSGFMTGDTAVSLGLTGSIARDAGENAGNYNYNLGTLAMTSDLGYLMNFAAGSFFTINPKTLNVSGLTASNKVYDGNTLASVSGGAIAGVIGADQVTLNVGAANFDNKNAGVGKTVTITGLGLTGTEAGNYVLASNSTTATADITAKSVNVSGTTILDKTYDGNTNATVSSFGSVAGLVGGDAVSLSTSGVNAQFADKNAGAGKAVGITGYALTGADAGNYSFVGTDSALASIAVKNITVSGTTANSKTYDASTVATLSSNGTLNDLVSGDVVNLNVGAASFDNKNAGTGKTVTVNGVSISGADATNYNLVSGGSITTTADIAKKVLTSSGTSVQDKTYDGTNSAVLNNPGVVSGVESGDVVAVDVSGAVASFADKNAGSNKAVNISGINLSGADAGNYSMSASGSTTATINQKSISLTGATANGKTYDGSISTTINSSGSTVGVIAGDVVNVDASSASASFADKNVGTNKTVTIAGLGINGADAGNYSLASNSSTSTADITAKTLTVSGSSVANKTYDGTTTATLNTAGSVNGVVVGDVVGLTGGTAAFADKNAGNGKSVAVTGLGINGADSGNYVLASSSTSTTADIAKKTISVSGSTAQDKTYDGNTSATINTGALSGVELGDVVSLTGGSGSFDNKNAGAGKTVTIAGLGINGADSGNYSLASSVVTTLATINQAALNIAAVTDSRVENGGTASSGVPVVTGLVVGDNITGLSQSFSGSAPGTHTISVDAGFSINDGNSGNNYFPPILATASGTITAAPVIVVPPVVVPPVAPVVPVMVTTTRVETSSEVSSPVMRADTVVLPTGGNAAQSAPVVELPAAPVASAKKEEKK